MDSFTNTVIQKWIIIAENNYSSLGFDAKKIVLTNNQPLDGRETEVRSHPANLTSLLAEAMAHAAPLAQVAFFNAGSVRVDDILQMPVTQYDTIRSLPFGGGIRDVEMQGSLLKKIIDQGEKNKGTGGYLVYNSSIKQNAVTGTWQINEKNISDETTYRVALTDFLLSGKEANLDYLTPKNPSLQKCMMRPLAGAMTDIRLALVQYLETKK